MRQIVSNIAFSGKGFDGRQDPLGREASRWFSSLPYPSIVPHGRLVRPGRTSEAPVLRTSARCSQLAGGACGDALASASRPDKSRLRREARALDWSSNCRRASFGRACLNTVAESVRSAQQQTTSQGRFIGTPPRSSKTTPGLALLAATWTGSFPARSGICESGWLATPAAGSTNQPFEPHVVIAPCVLKLRGLSREAAYPFRLKAHSLT